MSSEGIHRPLRVLIAGIGPHSERTHLPWLRHTQLAIPVAFVELPRCAAQAVRNASQFDNEIEIVLIEPWTGSVMPSSVRAKLDGLVRRLNIDCVIIATEPTAHAAYLTWAIDANLHAFVDKPIIMLPGSSNSLLAARRIESELRGIIVEAARHPRQLIAVGTERRYHPAFNLVNELLVEAAGRFETAVTAVQSSHADGQFRLPNELETISYHGYRDGYGKIGHSGYHEISLQADLIEATAAAAGVDFDEFTSYASAVRPAGFLKQIPRTTYERRFSIKAWNAACPEDHGTLARRMQPFGEVDVFATNTFVSDGDAVLLSQIGLLHTSMSRRSWLQPSKDLYKGNGRVKHEHHNFVLGPFMAVQVHSYQSRDKHDVNDENEFLIGGNNHIEVHVYRNSDWWDKRVPELEIYSANQLSSRAGMPVEQMFSSFAKEQMLDDFFLCASGRRPLAHHRSRIGSHLLGGTMLSTVFEAVATGTIARRSITAAVRDLGDAA